MKTSRGIGLSLLLFLLPACGQRLVEFAKPGPPDGGAADARPAKRRPVRDARCWEPGRGNPDVTSPTSGTRTPQTQTWQA
jgi:hypothetical protein